MFIIVYKDIGIKVKLKGNSMNRTKVLFLFNAFLFFTFLPASVCAQNSTSFQIKKWSLSNSAGTAASSNFKLKESALGGFAAGKSSSNRFVLNGGGFITSLKDSILLRTLLPQLFKLNQNYPNPFNPSTTITYSLPKTSDVKIRIYNVLGRTVRTVGLGRKPAGEHRFEWLGRDDTGSQLSSGTYYYQILADGFSDVKKMIMVK